MSSTHPFHIGKALPRYLILSMSTFLLGMYCGGDLPAEIGAITLQMGMLGVLTFIGIGHLAQQMGGLVRSTGQPSPRVESRLDRYVPAAHMHRPARATRRTAAVR